MSSNPRFGFVVEHVTDIEAARRFYVDVLGLEEERYDPRYVQFGSFAITTEASMDGSGAPELYWLVDDAAGAFDDLSRKAEVSMPLTQLPFGRLFAVKDPAGRPRYLLELASDRPSKPVS
jgi:catechol 2,3-dioxygenase-like lactoylglutathione lyase family enzyme